jgi:hypothetical protein
VSEPFRVAGFSVEGRVVDVDGEGISGATVLFDGVEKATTDADGFVPPMSPRTAYRAQRAASADDRIK